MAQKKSGSKPKIYHLETDKDFALKRLKSRYILLGIAWVISAVYLSGSGAQLLTTAALLGAPVVLGLLLWLSAVKRIRSAPTFDYQILRQQDGLTVRVDPTSGEKKGTTKEIRVTGDTLNAVQFRRELAGVTVTIRGKGYLIRIPGVEDHKALLDFITPVIPEKKLNYPLAGELPIPTWFWASLLPAAAVAALLYWNVIYVFYGFLIIFSNIGLSLFLLRNSLLRQGLSFAPLRLASLLVAVFTVVALINVYTVYSETGSLPSFLTR